MVLAEHLFELFDELLLLQSVSAISAEDKLSQAEVVYLVCLQPSLLQHFLELLVIFVS